VEIRRRGLAHDHDMVDAVQLKAVGGEIDIAGVGEDWAG
jgi:hypothetical protein